MSNSAFSTSGENGAAGAPGALILLDTTTETNAANIVVTGLAAATYSGYKVLIEATSAVNDNVQFYVRPSADGGTTPITTTNTVREGYDQSNATTINGKFVTTETELTIDGSLTGGNMGNGTNEQINATIDIVNIDTVRSTFFVRQQNFNFNGQFAHSDHVLVSTSGTTGVDSLIFIMSSGNITGTISIYGYSRT